MEDILKGKVGYDTCGLTKPTKFAAHPLWKRLLIPLDAHPKTFILSHTHGDHEPSVEGIRLIVPSPIYDQTKRDYERQRIKVELIEHTDYYETFQYFFNSKTGRYEKAKTYCCMFGEEIVTIPESEIQRELLAKFRSFPHGIVSRMSIRDIVGKPLREQDLPNGWYMANDSVWIYEHDKILSNTLPKCAPSITNGIVISDGSIKFLNV